MTAHNATAAWQNAGTMRDVLVLGQFDRGVPSTNSNFLTMHDGGLQRIAEGTFAGRCGNEEDAPKD
jgi:hypothetical protein